jgi:hypothetical protein
MNRTTKMDVLEELSRLSTNEEPKFWNFYPIILAKQVPSKDEFENIFLEFWKNARDEGYHIKTVLNEDTYRGEGDYWDWNNHRTYSMRTILMASQMVIEQTIYGNVISMMVKNRFPKPDQNSFELRMKKQLKSFKEN